LTSPEKVFIDAGMMRSMLSKQLRISLIALAALVFLYALLRLGFLVYNGPYFTGLPVPEVLLAFVYGLRFDLSGLLLLNLPILLLYNLPGHPSRKRWFGLILFGLFCTVNLFGIGFSLADYAYFPTIQRRLTYEPLIMSREILAMIPGLMVDYWHLSLLLVLADAGFVWISFRFLAFWEKREPYRFHPLKEGVSLLLLVGLVVLGIRGGLQSKPIRQSHAFFSSHRAVGYLALSTPFSILRSLKQEGMAGLALMPR
jgi:hypothetical protein